MPTENRSSNTAQMCSVPEGYMLVERSIWTEQQVEAATACITLLKVVPGMRDRDLAMAAIDAAQCKAPDISLSDLLTAAQPLGWVYDGGQEFTRDPDRAHDLRAEGIELTAVYGHAQHQGEPVALPALLSRDNVEHPKHIFIADGFRSGMAWMREQVEKLGPLYTHPAPVQQGEPVAWRGINELGEVVTEWIDGVPPERMVDLRRNPGSFAKIELAYSHPDAGEVERLHKEHIKALEACSELSEKQRDHWMAECKKRDFQLAERDVLLRDINKRHSSGVDFDLPADLAARVAAVCATSAEPKSCGACAGCTDVCQLDKDSPPIDAVIPASVERDEREAFEADVTRRFPGTLLARNRHKPENYLNLYVQSAWDAWQARAALERKP